MDHFLGLDSFYSVVFVLAVAVLAGLVKGVVGFAMPMIFISGLTLVLPPEQALAALIVPTLVTNGWQALRQGIGSAIQTVVQFRLFLACGLVMLVISAQLVRVLDARVLYGLIGTPVALFAALQLAGWHPKLAQRSARIEAAVGGVAGFIGWLPDGDRHAQAGTNAGTGRDLWIGRRRTCGVAYSDRGLAGRFTASNAHGFAVRAGGRVVGISHTGPHSAGGISVCYAGGSCSCGGEPAATCGVWLAEQVKVAANTRKLRQRAG